MSAAIQLFSTYDEFLTWATTSKGKNVIRKLMRENKLTDEDEVKNDLFIAHFGAAVTRTAEQIQWDALDLLRASAGRTRGLKVESQVESAEYDEIEETCRVWEDTIADSATTEDIGNRPDEILEALEMIGDKSISKWLKKDAEIDKLDISEEGKAKARQRHRAAATRIINKIKRGVMR